MCVFGLYGKWYSTIPVFAEKLSDLFYIHTLSLSKYIHRCCNTKNELYQADNGRAAETDTGLRHKHTHFAHNSKPFAARFSIRSHAKYDSYVLELNFNGQHLTKLYTQTRRIYFAYMKVLRRKQNQEQVSQAHTKEGTRQKPKMRKILPEIIFNSQSHCTRKRFCSVCSATRRLMARRILFVRGFTPLRPPRVFVVVLSFQRLAENASFRMIDLILHSATTSAK